MRVPQFPTPCNRMHDFRSGTSACVKRTVTATDGQTGRSWAIPTADGVRAIFLKKVHLVTQVNTTLHYRSCLHKLHICIHSLDFPGICEPVESEECRSRNSWLDCELLLPFECEAFSDPSQLERVLGLSNMHNIYFIGIYLQILYPLTFAFLRVQRCLQWRRHTCVERSTLRTQLKTANFT